MPIKLYQQSLKYPQQSHSIQNGQNRLLQYGWKDSQLVQESIKIKIKPQNKEQTRVLP